MQSIPRFYPARFFSLRKFLQLWDLGNSGSSDSSRQASQRSLCQFLFWEKICRSISNIITWELLTDIRRESPEMSRKNKLKLTWWFKVTFLGWLSDPFKGLSDLQLGDEKGTLNHLVQFVLGWLPSSKAKNSPVHVLPDHRCQRHSLHFLP